MKAIFFIAVSALSVTAGAQFTLRSGAPIGGAVVTTPHVRAELVAHAPEGVAAGRPLTLGLLIEHQKDWHTYWKNPGDSGLPTELAWQLPEGMQAGEIAWPLPRKIPIGALANYGYEGRVLLPVPVTVTPQFSADAQTHEVRFALHASWLVCRQECIPEEGRFTLSLPLQASSAAHAQQFAAAASAQPRPLSPAAGSGARVDADTLAVRVLGLPEPLHGQTLAVFPEAIGVLDNAAAPRQRWDGALWSAELPLSAQRSEAPPEMALVLASADGTQGVRLALAVDGDWPPLAARAQVSPVLAAALAANARAQQQAQTQAPSAASGAALLLALLGALLGGLLLNLMPCVFPVLAIKIVGIARHGHDRRAQRVGALVYAAGVLLSFLALGALMLALRAAGEAVGWGFQLQSPAVVAALALLFTLIALNLAGVFELRSVLPARLASVQARHPLADSFLTGVLAVAVASPCTAPFMGAALGLTATLPAWQALAVFATLGLGLALPYVLASWLPALGQLLPGPGVWMVHLRRLLAFPMLATVVWLVWVLGQQSGINGAAALLALLVLLALALWTLTLSGRWRALLAPAAIAAGVWLAWAWAPLITTLAPPAYGQGAPAVDASGWQPWSSERTEALLAQGRPVFVDYTAAWCVTCQYNKQTTLANADVLQDFSDKRVALLRADWTRRDPLITASLAQLGRSGVPVYVLYAPGRAPVMFSEILRTQSLRQALAQL